jgi:hypothetical protein
LAFEQGANRAEKEAEKYIAFHVSNEIEMIKINALKILKIIVGAALL